MFRFIKFAPRRLVNKSFCSVKHLRSVVTSPTPTDFIVKSKFSDIENCDGITIPEYVESYEKPSWKTSVAYECGVTGAKITHSEVLRNSKCFAVALRKAGLKPGETVGIILPNNIHYASMLYGIIKAGLIACPVNPAYIPAEMIRQVQDSESKCIITIPDFVPALRTIQKSDPDMKIIVLGESVEGCHTYTEMIKTDPAEFSSFKRSGINTKEEIAMLPYSSGTTGLPKGVCLTHFSVVSNMMQMMKPNCLSIHPGNDRVVAVLPFFHAYGMMSFMFSARMNEAHTLCLPRFEPATFLKAIREHQPTILHLVPPLMNMLAASPEYGQKEFEKIHTIVGGAAPIGPALIEKLLQKAGKYFLFQEAYGLTELSPLATIISPDTKNSKVGSCGRLVASTLGKIVSTDGSGKVLGRHERGELCIKGDQIMKGYWKNEKATKETIDEDGWFHTGDIGYYDEDDYFYIVDRMKELIKVKGFQVAPAELEALLCQHPLITEAAVIGIPNPEAGECPRAFVVAKDPKLTAEEINAFLNDKISHFKQLKGGIEFVEAIPKAPSGKILRRVLKVEYFQKNGIPLP